MEPKLQRRIQRYGWDKASESYEPFWSRQLKPAQDRLLEVARLRPGERVLDLACGTGLITFPAAEQVGENGAVVATDLSQKMVETIERETAARRLSHVRAVRMGSEELRFEDGSFDVVLNGLGLMYVPDPPRAHREMHRVLRSGGRGVAAVWGERRRCGWAEIFPIVDRRVHSEVCPMFFQLGTQDILERGFHDAGFQNVESERLLVTLHYESEEEALGAAFAGGPVALAYSRFDDRTREEAHREYLASIEPFRRGNRYEIPGEFVVVAGRKA